MSAMEILVLVGGVVLGYFVVSKLYDELFGNRGGSDPKAGGDRKPTDRQGRDPER